MNPFDAFKQFRRDRVIRRAYGTRDPQLVTLPQTGRTLRVNPADRRVRKVLLYDPLRGRTKTNQSWWQTAAAAFAPTLAIDVGLNYGECLLGTDYPPGCRCHGFEANAALLPYLSESLAGHPQRESIRVHEAAVAAEAGLKLSFVIDQQWSGRSHLAAASDDRSAGVEARTVTTTTLDASVPRPTASDRVLFKIDVEGFEPDVLAGGLSTLCGDAPSLGFVEFDPEVHEKRGFDVADYWGVLADRFRVYRCARTGEATPITAADWSAARGQIASRHCDLILEQGDSEFHRAALHAWRASAVCRAA